MCAHICYSVGYLGLVRVDVLDARQKLKPLQELLSDVDLHLLWRGHFEMFHRVDLWIVYCIKGVHKDHTQRKCTPTTNWLSTIYTSISSQWPRYSQQNVTLAALTHQKAGLSLLFLMATCSTCGPPSATNRASLSITSLVSGSSGGPTAKIHSIIHVLSSLPPPSPHKHTYSVLGLRKFWANVVLNIAI